MCHIPSHFRVTLSDVDTTVSRSLSKSLFIRGRQCVKSLWLHKHRPELRDETSSTQEARFRSGHEIGALARQFFPGGVEVPYDGLSVEGQVALTRKLVGDGCITIYEAAFVHDDIFVKADILHRAPAGWEVYEVKASTAVKDYHYADLALQVYMLAGAGVDVASAGVVHVDSSYVRSGAIDVHRLFHVEDVTADVREMLPEVAEQIPELRRALAGKMPAIDIGPHCNDPYPCDFQGHCWSHIPEDSVFDLRGKGVDTFALYRAGIVRIADIPLETLNQRQRQQVESTLHQRNHLDKDEVRAFLESLWYPLCYLDFETVNPAVPLFDQSRPYQQIPFQYSLHVQLTKGKKLVHHEFLGLPGVDPRPELTRRLLAGVPEGACIVAWNQGFERGVLGGLARLRPEWEVRIQTMLDSFRDLMSPFRARSVYRWGQKGSYSIKAVLPLVVPDLSYDGLEVADGEMAMDAYYEMCETKDPEDVARIRSVLLRYCETDTLAMARIVAALRSMVR